MHIHTEVNASAIHDDTMTWTTFPHYWPLAWVINGFPEQRANNAMFWWFVRFKPEHLSTVKWDALTHLSIPASSNWITIDSDNGCRLFGAEPLPKPMMTSRQPHHSGINPGKKYRKSPIFTDEIALDVILCHFAAIFYPGGDELMAMDALSTQCNDSYTFYHWPFPFDLSLFLHLSTIIIMYAPSPMRDDVTM